MNFLSIAHPTLMYNLHVRCQILFKVHHHSVLIRLMILLKMTDKWVIRCFPHMLSVSIQENQRHRHYYLLIINILVQICSAIPSNICWGITAVCAGVRTWTHHRCSWTIVIHYCHRHTPTIIIRMLISIVASTPSLINRTLILSWHHLAGTHSETSIWPCAKI